MRTRLDSVLPELAARLARAGPHQQRAAALAAAAWAVQTVGLDCAVLDAALARLAEGFTDQPPDGITQLVEQLDGAAWDLRDAGDEAGYDVAFRQARAAGAVESAFSGDSSEAAVEAVYEAFLATDDEDATVAVVERAIVGR